MTETQELLNTTRNFAISAKIRDAAETHQMGIRRDAYCTGVGELVKITVSAVLDPEVPYGSIEDRTHDHAQCVPCKCGVANELR